MRRLTLALLLLVPAALACADSSYPGTKLIDFFGYTGCLQLSNADTSVILDPNCGGRVLSYQNSGIEAIPLNPAQQGYTWQPGGKIVDVYGGRFDVGPEMTLPRHLDLWIGRWRGRFTGPREAELISPIDSNTKLQLVRTFRLDERTSHLRCTQKIINRGPATRRCCHWSRTFAMGNGIAIVPLNPLSRFPRKYLTYGPGNVMDYSPKPSENVRVRDGFLEIKGDPPFSKFMLDPVGPWPDAGYDAACGPSAPAPPVVVPVPRRGRMAAASPLPSGPAPEAAPSRAWLAYLLQSGRLFVKRFPVYPQRAYAEACAASLSLYYYPFTEDRQKPADKRPLPIDFCELEPIGPQEILTPGQSASFTEDWYLLPHPFPQPGTDLDLKAVQQQVLDQTN